MSNPSVRLATPEDAVHLAELAARTFPMACPPELPAAHIQEFVRAELNADRFAAHLRSPDDRVFLASDGSGYAWALHGVHTDQGPAQWRERRSAYLSKLYVDAGAHGGGLAQALMAAVTAAAAADDCAGVWLGVNRQNARALRFYGKCGFALAGERTFTVGETVFVDDVLCRPFHD
ncbi:GNAT family N-acetyltransferase [Dermacoccaceae bacterium W4C1]